MRSQKVTIRVTERQGKTNDYFDTLTLSTATHKMELSIAKYLHIIQITDL